MPARAARPKWTVLEFAIVAVVLGVLAAILVPQASTASPEDRRAELGRRLMDLRSQLALYKAQHAGCYPTADGTAAGVWQWTKLTGRTDASGLPTSGPAAFGPYFPASVVNPQSDLSDDWAATVVGAGKPLAAGDPVATRAGWVLDASGTLFALTRTGERVYDEGTPRALARADD